MNIAEDYCSFEVAKLLKEKGFNISPDSKNWICCMYDENGNIHWGIYDKNWYPRITHQMTIAWLREVYSLYIWVEYSRFDFNKEHPYLWNIAETIINGVYWGGTYHKSHEDAVESALKYTLENLI